MPRDSYGQLITFAIERDADQTFSQYVYYVARKGDTVKKIAGRRGRPDQAATIAQLNKIRSVYTPLKAGRRLRLPGIMKQGEKFDVLPQADSPPIVIDGYALTSIVSRPGGVGLNQFDGYNPISMKVPIHFHLRSGVDAADVEAHIDLLERMAGRGNFRGAASGAPAVIRVSVTDNRGIVVPLIPPNFQWSQSNPTAPLWRISQPGSGSGIVWDESPRRDDDGRRIDAKAVVYLGQYTPISVVVNSAAERSRQRNSQPVP